MPLNLPNATSCFVDTNILYSHFVASSSDVSEQCSQFIERIVVREVDAFCSVPVLADLVHKVMMSEAREHFPPAVATGGLTKQLLQTKAYLPQLTAFAQLPEQLKAIPLKLLPVSINHLRVATEVSKQFGLLTNDAIIVAMMREHGIAHIATNDDDFDHVPGITTWKPRS